MAAFSVSMGPHHPRMRLKRKLWGQPLGFGPFRKSDGHVEMAHGIQGAGAKQGYVLVSTTCGCTLLQGELNNVISSYPLEEEKNMGLGEIQQAVFLALVLHDEAQPNPLCLSILQAPPKCLFHQTSMVVRVGVGAGVAWGQGGRVGAPCVLGKIGIVQLSSCL